MNQFQLLNAELKHTLPAMRVNENVPMSGHTSFRIGGPAALMAHPTDEIELARAVAAARMFGIEPFILGRGTNVLADDGPLERFVIKLTEGFSSIVQTGRTELTAGAGVSLTSLAVFACEQGLAGLEFAHGIPGSLGGAVYMNAGAYGGEMKDVVAETAYLRDGVAPASAAGEAHNFSYRHSCFADRRDIITSVRLNLRPGSRDVISAGMRGLAEKRRDSQPLEYPSAGSMFKRPRGGYAAQMIDECGLKGLRSGGAAVSEKHAGFIINLGGATCTDVLKLVNEIRTRVNEQFGVMLELEPRRLTAQER